MMLLTKKIKSEMPKLYENESKNPEDIKIVVKFFTPDANYTWYVVVGEERGSGDWLFFGYVDGTEGELGYFTLSQLKTVRGALGLPVERDMYFGDKTLRDVMK